MKSLCDECGLPSSGRRTRCIPCDKMICSSCWKFGFGCKYPKNREEGIYLMSKPHRSNIKTGDEMKSKKALGDSRSLYMFEVFSFGKGRTPVCEYGQDEVEARERSKSWLKRGEKLGRLLEINGMMVDLPVTRSNV